MLGTGDVAIIYHISSTAANGWLAGHSDTASKPRRQQAVHPTSRARLSANPETRRRGRRVSGARPSTFLRYLAVVVILESQSRWPNTTDSRPGKRAQRIRAGGLSIAKI